jgi:dCTP deaminase
MVLTDKTILEAIQEGNIVITPFKKECLGSNSYDVHLGSRLGVYVDDVIDAKKDNKLEIFDIPDEGYVLMPNKLYLGVTSEYTETYNLVPVLEGKSSTGRLGICIHLTAGLGDVNFKGNWVLEITAVIPVRIYKNMPIGQLVYNSIEGECLNPYDKKESSKYKNQNDTPIGSKMYLNNW